MKPPHLFGAVVASVFSILFVGLVGDLLGGPTPASIPYQGRLLDENGSPLDGSFQMRFQLWSEATGGNNLWDSGVVDVAVSDGLFQTELEVDQADFTGKELFLRIRVGSEWLLPRQPLRPAPYALGLVPGSRVHGPPAPGSQAVLEVEMPGAWPAATTLRALAPTTGTAMIGEASGGAGIYAYSQSSYAVWGASQNSWGGYFTSEGGYGVRVVTNGSAHWDHGVYVNSNAGYGVYAQSASNMAVRGEAGNITGLNQPLGPVGVVGIGASRGVYGSSGNGTGVYGSSDGNYGLWGQSETYRGITGRTDRSDNDYGIYTPDNLFANAYSRAGSTSQVAQNGGSEPIEPGDVVVLTGVAPPLEKGGSPVILVAKAGTVESTGIAGVAASRFNAAVTLSSFDLDYTRALEEARQREDRAAIEQLNRMASPTLPGPARAGEFVLVVVHGPARVKANAVATAGIRPGDELVLSEVPGIAMRRGEDAGEPANSARLGQALESLDAGEEAIYVFVR